MTSYITRPIRMRDKICLDSDDWDQFVGYDYDNPSHTKKLHEWKIWDSNKAKLANMYEYMWADEESDIEIIRYPLTHGVVKLDNSFGKYGSQFENRSYHLQDSVEIALYQQQHDNNKALSKFKTMFITSSSGYMLKLKWCRIMPLVNPRSFSSNFIYNYSVLSSYQKVKKCFRRSTM